MNYVKHNYVVDALRNLLGNPGHSAAVIQPQVILPKTIREIAAMSLGSASIFLRLAGLSGALAVGLGAYGSHTLLRTKDDPEKRNLKEVFKTANQYHFYHTLALLAVPFTGKPMLVGCLLMSGMIIFCGTCYNYSLRGDETFKRLTPYGGTLLIAAWLAFLL